MADIVKCKPLVNGRGAGPIMATEQNISFWGGVNPANGRIIDPRHELFDQSITGKVLAFPSGKGSTSAPQILLELAKHGTAPAAMVNIQADALLVAGPIISKHFYGISIPVVSIDRETFDHLKMRRYATVDGVQGEILMDD